MIKLQRIRCYHETFPCLVVEQFQLGLLTWRDDVRRWFICNSETSSLEVTVNPTYYPTFKRFSDQQQRTSVKELKQEERALVRKPFFFTVRITNCMN